MCDQERIVDGVLRSVGPVVLSCLYAGVHHRWQLYAKPWGPRPQPANLEVGAA
jgi:hypothetical protein